MTSLCASSIVGLVVLFLTLINVQSCSLECQNNRYQCSWGCSVYSGAEYVEAGLYHLLTDCYLQCNLEFELCCVATPGSENGGNVVAANSLPGIGEIGIDVPTDDQAAAANNLLRVCGATLEDLIGTVDQTTGVISLEGFERHVALFTNEICPTVDSSVEEYYDQDFYTYFYAALSCELCLGIYDPNNMQNAQDDSFENCGCPITGTNPTLVPLIQVDRMTPNESAAYCSFAYDMVYTNCQRPPIDCFETCRNRRYECTSNCLDVNQLSNTIFLQCYNECNPIYYPCIEACSPEDSVEFEFGLPKINPIDPTQSKPPNNSSSAKTGNNDSVITSAGICNLGNYALWLDSILALVFFAIDL